MSPCIVFFVTATAAVNRKELHSSVAETEKKEEKKRERNKERSLTKRGTSKHSYVSTKTEV